MVVGKIAKICFPQNCQYPQNQKGCSKYDGSSGGSVIGHIGKLVFTFPLAPIVREQLAIFEKHAKFSYDKNVMGKN